MREALARMHEGVDAALDAVTVLELAFVDNAPPSRIEGMQRALADLADGFRGLATLAMTTAGTPLIDARRTKRMADAAARVVFEKRGNHAEAHLSEVELGAILEATILLALELR